MARPLLRGFDMAFPRSPSIRPARLRHALPFLTALVAIALGGAGARPSAAEVWSERLPLGPGGLVEVEFDLGEGLRPDPGSLVIRSHPADEVLLEVEADGWGSWSLEPRLERSSDRIRAEVRVTGATSWMFGGPQVRVRLLVPRKTALEVRAKGGPMRIEAVAGPVRARIRDGSLEIRDVEGDVKLRVQQGDVDAEELHGDLEVSCTDGSIQANGVAGDVEARSSEGGIHLQHLGGRAVAKTLSGDVEISDVHGAVEARTEEGTIRVAFAGSPEGSLVVEQGDLEVEVPAGAGFSLDGAVTRGELDVAESLLPGHDAASTAVRARVGAGGGRLLLRSSRGRIRLNAR